MKNSDQVYGEYTQERLDAQYRQFTRDSDNQPYIERWESLSEAIGGKLEYRTLSYGPRPKQKIDLFPGSPDNAGLVVFFHGGSWSSQEKEQFHYIAESMVTDGFAYAAVGFDHVPEVTLGQQVEQAIAAIEFLARNPQGYSGQAIYVVGHATGAHLAAMAVTTNWPKRLGVDTCPIKGGMLISGIYDLEPVRLSKRNEYLQLAVAQAADLSPIQRVREHPCPLVIGWGADELDEFKRQSQSFADAWRRSGGRCNAFELPGSNHMDMSLELGDPDGPLLRAFLNIDEEAT